MEEPMPNLLSIEEYLELEETSQIKHEYVAGEVFAMVGSTLAHNQLISNLLSELKNQVEGPCKIYFNEVKVRVDAVDCFYYPDLVLTCEAYSPTGRILKEPILIVEVLSPSTELIDRREKRVNYSKLTSLEHYVLVHQDRPHIEVFSKAGLNNWKLHRYESGDVILRFCRSNEVLISMESLYDGVLDQTP